jgi:hypothetical protein
MQLQRHALHLSEESETVAASTTTARKTRYRGIRRDSGDYHHSTRHGCPLSPLGGMPNGGRFMRMPPLAGLERRNVRVRGHGPRQLPSGPPEGDPPYLFPATGGPSVKRNTVNDTLIRVITPAARSYISPGQVTDQATGSTLMGVVVMAKWSYMRRYVTDARAALCEGKLVALANSDPTAGVAPTALTDAGTVPRAAVLCPPGPQTPRLARRVQELGAQVLVRGAIAVPSRCPCMDHCPRCALVSMMLCKLHPLDRRGR